MQLAKSKFIWSKYQEDIFDISTKTNKNIIISAVAGSAKTTTIIELSSRLPKTKKVIFTAFNKSISEELKTKLPFNIECSHLHSIGMKLLLKYYGNLKVTDYKTSLLSDKLVRNWNIEHDSKDLYKWHLSKAIDLIRLNDVDINDNNAVLNIFDYYDIYIESNSLKHIKEIYLELDKYNKNMQYHKEKMISFVDMISLPLENKIQFPKYDVVIVDEAQDNNILQQKFIENLIKPFTGRFIVALDPKQSIYGFMGADQKALQKWESKPNTIKLPLSVCYRCAKNIVKKAQELVPEIECYDKQEDGEFIENSTLDVIEAGHWVLARNNKPLFQLYFELIKMGKKCKIKDNDLLKSLLLMIKKVINKNYTDAFAYLYIELSKIKDDLKSRKIINYKKHPSYENYKEKIDIINILSENYENMKEMHSHLHEIFESNHEDIILMTIFKSKGLENYYVHIVNPKLLDEMYRYTGNNWTIQVQKNLKYIAYTRAKKKLFIIPETTWNGEKL